MIRLDEKIEVNEAIDGVFDYVSDFRFLPDWEPGVSEAVKVTPGPVGVDTVYRLTLRYPGVATRMTCQIAEFNRPNLVTVVGRGATFKTIDRIRFATTGDQTTVGYRTEIEFDGERRMVEAAVKPLLRTASRKAARRLSAAFAGRFSPARIGIGSHLLDRTIIGGMLGFTRSAFEYRRRRFTPMPGFLHGKTAVVTGATSGIGRIVAGRFASLGARVVMISRDPAKAERVRAEIIKEGGHPEVVSYTADLSVMRDVRRVAAQIVANEAAVHILVNNAGALYSRPQLTIEGIESTIATNLLGPYLLTTLLKSRVVASAPARIINVSSGGMYTQKLNAADLEFKRGVYKGEAAYARAKRALVILSEGWAKELQNTGVTVHAMHPGWVATPGLKIALPAFYSFVGRQLRTPGQGADTIVWLATAPAAVIGTGQFWLDRQPHTTYVLPGTRESDFDRAALWRRLESLHQRAVA